MNFRTLQTALLCALATLPAAAQINITYPGSDPVKARLVSIPIDEYAKGSRAVQTVLRDSVMISGQGVLNTPKFNAINFLTFGNEERQTFFTAPGETIEVNVTSIEPLDVRFGGSKLLEQMQSLADELAPIMDQYQKLKAADALTDEAMEKIYNDYDRVLVKYIQSNPTEPGAAYAITALQDAEAQMELFPQLSGDAVTSVIYPLAESSRNRAAKTLEAEARQKALESGSALAPDFTLPDLNGKPVSLAQFRGKWVILDFWGSWCMWCIKGFPALKEAYAKYDGKVEVIGIDCGDSPEAWKAAVEKFKLPWVHVYNADVPDSVDKLYGIQGFPTKMIVDPEGHIVNITTGEDPEFFNVLEKFVK